jgi:hypothetical protein
MKDLTATKEWKEMRNNIRRVVHSLEVCWKCQHVSECQKYILGQTVLVWLCKGCLTEMDKPVQFQPKARVRRSANLLGTWEAPH